MTANPVAEEPAPPDALPVGASIGGYQVESVIGRGGFGITYQAFNPVTGRRVAIKEFFPQGLANRRHGAHLQFSTADADIARWSVNRFKATTTALCGLAHPNIVKVFDYVPANDTGYMVMELLEGRTLSNWLEANPRPTLEQLRPVIEPVMEALAYVHEQGLVHRDVAPDNILVTHDGRPVLIDFGSASKELGAHGRASTLATYKAFYTAPEYTAPRAAPDLYADIYSLGAVIYCAIAGEPPEDARERMSAVALGDRADPYAPLAGRTFEGWPPQALAAIDAALAFDKRKRPASVETFRLALQPPPPEPAIAAAGAGRKIAIAAGLTAAVTAGVCYAAWFTPADGGLSALRDEMKAVMQERDLKGAEASKAASERDQKSAEAAKAASDREAAAEALRQKSAELKDKSEEIAKLQAAATAAATAAPQKSGRQAELESEFARLSSVNADLEARLIGKDALIQKAQIERDEAKRDLAKASTPQAGNSPPVTRRPSGDEPVLRGLNVLAPPAEFVPISGPAAGWSTKYDTNSLKLLQPEVFDSDRNAYVVEWQGRGNALVEFTLETRGKPDCQSFPNAFSNSIKSTFSQVQSEGELSTVPNYETYKVEGLSGGRIVFAYFAMTKDKTMIISIVAKYPTALERIYREKLRDMLNAFVHPKASIYKTSCAG